MGISEGEVLEGERLVEGLDFVEDVKAHNTGAALVSIGPARDSWRDEHEDHIVKDIPRRECYQQQASVLESRQTHEMIMRGLNRRFENGNLEGMRSILQLYLKR